MSNVCTIATLHYCVDGDIKLWLAIKGQSSNQNKDNRVFPILVLDLAELDELD